jgi:hypothetical protein
MRLCCSELHPLSGEPYLLAGFLRELKTMLARVFVPTLAAIALLVGPTVARDANGFWMGGGVGGLGCPEFLNAMATARQKGGLRSIAGVRETGA